MKKRSLAMIMALVLILGAVAGGTIAWLTDTTKEVKNTFTVGKVDITLMESPLLADGTYGNPAEGTENAYKLIPGATYTKDPTVTVTTDSEDCWLFVKFEENGNAATYIDYTSTLTEANGWTRGDGDSIPVNVWYREVKATDTGRSWKLLENDSITINANAVTADNMNVAAQVELVYTAYAVQKDNLTAQQAWQEIAPAQNP